MDHRDTKGVKDGVEDAWRTLKAFGAGRITAKDGRCP